MAAEAGMKPREIDDATISELMIVMEAKWNDTIFQLRNVRTIAFFAVAAHLEKGASMEKFMPLPGDELRLSGDSLKEKIEQHRRRTIQRESLKKINGTARP
jgi:hypothetical protein